ncbi:MAG TPA: hypothetical protein VFD06_11500 [Candidatus Polarisedimenticolia bacterium]|nr:hypothetical protein [Candidatus Polarisedimenticolia bacterium]
MTRVVTKGAVAAFLLVASMSAEFRTGAADPPRPRAKGKASPSAAGPRLPSAIPEFERAADSAIAAIVSKHGAGSKVRAERGVKQVLRAWRQEDGAPSEFERLVTTEFFPEGAELDGCFDRLEALLERIDGYFLSLGRDLRFTLEVETGPIRPIDERLGAWDPGAHVQDDLFGNGTAFVVLVNFRLTTLDERLKEGPGWTRRQWAEARLADRFARRLPAEVSQQIQRAYVEAEAYIARDNIMMHHLLDEKGGRPFPAGMRLLSHWNLRDEIKALYSDPAGLASQRMIARVMERIVTQEIPEAVIDNPLLDWNPVTNAVTRSSVRDLEPPPGKSATPSNAREPDTRYRTWMAIAAAARRADPFDPEHPNLIARRFEVDREIPEAETKALLLAVLEAPIAQDAARLIAQRLGRPLEPFDIWYAGFKPRSRYTEADLDARTKARYPTAADYAADMPRMFKELGFDREQARFLAANIEVDPSRGSGHAQGAERRDDQVRLRTRVGPGGMDYKGYNIAVHEMGHNVEQSFSLDRIDHWFLHGVPNNAFTEALAMVFQGHDVELLGLEKPSGDAEASRALEEFWGTREIAGVALVDMAAWHWLVAHPDGTPAQFREAVVGAARDVWNRHFADLVGARDVPLLAIYSHMVSSALYTPDYPLGHLIAFQLEEHFRKQKKMGPEFERVCRIGRVTPDLWMRQAVGGPLSAAPLLDAAARALRNPPAGPAS